MPVEQELARFLSPFVFGGVLRQSRPQNASRLLCMDDVAMQALKTTVTELRVEAHMDVAADLGI